MWVTVRLMFDSSCITVLLIVCVAADSTFALPEVLPPPASPNLKQYMKSPETHQVQEGGEGGEGAIGVVAPPGSPRGLWTKFRGGFSNEVL